MKYVPASCKPPQQTVNSSNNLSPLQIKNCCRRQKRSQSFLTSTSSEASSSFGKPKHESVIARIKEMIPILKVFFPLTIYWAISYQRSSTWILQGVMMDCRLGSVDVPPGTSINGVMQPHLTLFHCSAPPSFSYSSQY